MPEIDNTATPDQTMLPPKLSPDNQQLAKSLRDLIMGRIGAIDHLGTDVVHAFVHDGDASTPSLTRALFLRLDNGETRAYQLALEARAAGSLLFREPLVRGNWDGVRITLVDHFDGNVSSWGLETRSRWSRQAKLGSRGTTSPNPIYRLYSIGRDLAETEADYTPLHALRIVKTILAQGKPDTRTSQRFQAMPAVQVTTNEQLIADNFLNFYEHTDHALGELVLGKLMLTLEEDQAKPLSPT